MKLRIGSCNDRYWVEGKLFLRWKIMPCIRHFIEFREIAFDVKYREYYPDYETAFNVAKEFQILFCKQAHVHGGIIK